METIHEHLVQFLVTNRWDRLKLNSACLWTAERARSERRSNTLAKYSAERRRTQLGGAAITKMVAEEATRSVLMKTTESRQADTSRYHPVRIRIFSSLTVLCLVSPSFP